MSVPTMPVVLPSRRNTCSLLELSVRTSVETVYKQVDVGDAEEFDDRHTPGTILMPRHEWRNRMDELGKNQRYIVYCHAGGRSAVATLVPAQKPFEMVSLDGDIRD